MNLHGLKHWIYRYERKFTEVSLLIGVALVLHNFFLKPTHPFADTSNGYRNSKSQSAEGGIVKTQNRESQRKRKQRRDAENRSDTVILTATSFNIWDTLKQFHPYKNEILNVVRILNSIGVNCSIIAATLGLQGWKTFYGDCEWTEEDVKGLLD